MELFFLILLLALNFGISWWNAYVCGKAWVETKHIGGWIRLVVWCGAIQSAIGFSMVFLFGIVGVGLLTGLIEPAVLSLATAFFYLAIIIPALGTGIIITVHSWIVAYRERDLMSMGVAAYNTMATAYNIYSSVNGIGAAFSTISETIGEIEDSRVMLALMIAAVAILGGVLLTATLIQRYAATVPLPDHPGQRALGMAPRQSAWTR